MIPRTYIRLDFSAICANMYTDQHKAFTMTASATMTIRVSPETKQKLERIAADTRRSKSFLAAEAISAYVDRELEIIEGIKRGMDDVEAGRVVPHEQVMAEARQIIADVKRKKTARG
jgi:predicted transcriptional regulator